MNSDFGVEPPLHRRFDRDTAIEHIHNRYHQCRMKIEKQVEVLQKEASFLKKCQSFYEEGYKDWVLLSAISSCMLTWKARKVGLLNPDDDPQRYLELVDTFHDTLFPPNRFLGKEMDIQVRKVHGILALQTYGFEIRRKDLKPEVVEKFLHERMRHFSFDLPHKPLFGEPIGEWPKT